MARSRNIKPGFFSNELLAEVEPLGRLLFAGLWTIADREGRLEDRPKRIKGLLLPYDACDGEHLLAELAKRGFILRYTIEGKAFIQVVAWKRHQNPHVNEAPSLIPAHEEHGASTVQAPDEHGSNPADSLYLIPDSLKQKQAPGTALGTCLAPGDPGAPPAAAVLVMPCKGKGPREWSVTQVHLTEWRKAYPGVDVLAEAHKMLLWLQAHPKRQKDFESMPGWAVAWLGNAQNPPAGRASPGKVVPLQVGGAGAPGAKAPPVRRQPATWAEREADLRAIWAGSPADEIEALVAEQKAEWDACHEEAMC